MGASSSALHARSKMEKRRKKIRRPDSEGQGAFIAQVIFNQGWRVGVGVGVGVECGDDKTSDNQQVGNESNSECLEQNEGRSALSPPPPDSKTRSIDTDSKNEQEENLEEHKTTSFVDKLPFDKALGKLGLLEHEMNSAKNIMKKNKDIFDSLLLSLRATVCMKTETDRDVLNYVEQMNLNFFSVSFEKRAIIGEFLKEVNFPLISFQKYKQVLNAFGQKTLNETKLGDDDGSQIIALIRGHWWNYSDCSTSFASSLVTHGIVQEMVQDLNNLKDCDERTIKMSFTFESAIGVLHNVAKNENHRQTFRDLKLVDIVGNFLKHENVPKITMLVLLTLALIIDENQTDLLFSHESSFNLLIRLAKRAWKGPDHRYDGFSLEELVLGLKGLSKNDKVKRLLVDKDILSLVSDILVDGKEDEKDIAAKLLWELSFDSTNKTVILGTELLMTTLKSVSKNSGKVARSCQGVLWVLEMEAADNVKAPKKKKKAETEKAVPESAGHVMISYNWGDQKQLLKVKESLKQLGFSIWMDVDNISGSTLQAMAEAVEGSSAVLVCMSEKYKESINCRSEAEYAFSLKKPIIPLLMQEGYKADGWLGILLGTKLFFDFSGRFSFESKLSELEKELNGRGISATAGDDKVDGPIVKVAAPLVGKGPSKNQNMTEVDVKAWVLEHQLDKLSIFNSMQAKHLSFLKKISMKAPEFYYSFLLDLMHDKISMEDLNNLLRITDAVGKLPS